VVARPRFGIVNQRHSHRGSRMGASDTRTLRARLLPNL